MGGKAKSRAWGDELNQRLNRKDKIKFELYFRIAPLTSVELHRTDGDASKTRLISCDFL